jgi:hypothetical protein
MIMEIWPRRGQISMIIGESGFLEPRERPGTRVSPDIRYA